MLKVSENKELLGVWGWKEINFSQGILEDIVFQLKKRRRIMVRTLSLRSMASAAQGSRQAFQYQV